MENKEPISRYKVVDLVHSRNSRFLKIEGLFSFDQVNIWISVNRRRKREYNSLKIYTLFQFFREYFFIHLMDDEFLKLISKEEYSFTWNPYVHVLE